MNIKSFVKEISLINSSVLKIRKHTPKRMGSWKEPADLLIKKENFNGKVVDAINITLTPTGCEWANTGGCTMCGEWSGSNLGKKIDAEYHIAQFASCVAQLLLNYQSPWIKIFQEGNYINSREFDTFAQVTIIRLASLLKGVKRITIEGMARYINEDIARLLKDSIHRDVELEVGIGFESQNEIIRMVCINKGQTIPQFEKAVKILKLYGFKTLAYVLLKPAFLTEKEAIIESIKTIKKAFEIGFDRVSLEPLSVHEWSLTEALHKNGLYDTPWLWSVIEVIKKTYHLGEIRVGGIEYYPRPSIIARNHHINGSHCSKIIPDAIKKFNETQDITVFNNLSCTCKRDWEKKLLEQTIPVKERITLYLSKISLDDYLQLKQNPGKKYA